MTKVTFETSTLADSIRKANSIAPTRGQGFDKAAGIVIKLAPGTDNEVVVMSTDTDVFYMETVGCIKVEGDAAVWRLSSQALTAVITNLPNGSSHTVTLDDSKENHRILIQSGRIKAKLNILDSNYYPFWDPFATEDIVNISDLGKIIQRVQWAGSSNNAQLKSIFITNNCIFSTDKFKVARVKVDTSVTGHLVVPSGQLGKVLPRDGDIKVSESDKIFVVMPDDYTQIATTTYDVPLFPVDRLLDAHFNYNTNFSKTQFLEMLNRALAFDSGNRQSIITLIVGKGEMAAMIDDTEIGLFGEVINASGSAADHERLYYKAGPATLRDAINSMPTENVTLKYNRPDQKPSVMVFEDGNNYSCAIALSKHDEKKEEDND